MHIVLETPNPAYQNLFSLSHSPSFPPKNPALSPSLSSHDSQQVGGSRRGLLAAMHHHHGTARLAQTLLQGLGDGRLDQHLAAVHGLHQVTPAVLDVALHLSGHGRH
mmetsp:Transcript_17025/g.23409  ORF Transcript_17025/g.23409 Transcript_17025/m.23409 type:complete len:107 (+) Transcript_17025:27-347(+)